MNFKTLYSWCFSFLFIAVVVFVGGLFIDIQRSTHTILVLIPLVAAFVFLVLTSRVGIKNEQSQLSTHPPKSEDQEIAERIVTLKIHAMRSLENDYYKAAERYIHELNQIIDELEESARSNQSVQ
jgi:hypothetical protein